MEAAEARWYVWLGDNAESPAAPYTSLYDAKGSLTTGHRPHHHACIHCPRSKIHASDLVPGLRKWWRADDTNVNTAPLSTLKHESWLQSGDRDDDFVAPGPRRRGNVLRTRAIHSLAEGARCPVIPSPDNYAHGTVVGAFIVTGEGR